MARFLVNFTTGGRGEAAARLRAGMWGIGDDEPHRDALVQGDLILLYLAAEREFIGRAEAASPIHEWTATEAEAYPGDSRAGVLLSRVEEWSPAIPMDVAAERIDPTASNPIVQTNAAAGFRMGLVQLTDEEYEAVVVLSREARAR